jgi:hypothetical protein
MFSLKSLYLSCALAALSTVPAFATTVIYTDKVTWQNASAGLTSIGFDGIATTGQTVNYANSTGLVINGVNFVAYNGTTSTDFNIINPTPGSYFDYSSGAELYWTPSSINPFIPYLKVTLPQAVTSASLDLMSFGGSNVAYNVALNDLNFLYSSTPTIGYPTRTFFGITSDVPFTSIAFQLPANGVTPLVDNFSFGTTSSSSSTETPEACTFLLIASGLISIARWGRRWTKAPVLSRESLPALS